MESIRHLIGIATYNEIGSLPTLVAQIRDQYPDFDILIVDDDSPDGTGDWCRDFAQRDNRLRLIERPTKSGLGGAVKRIVQTAVDEEYTWLITMDADLSHNPAELRRLLAAMADADVVIGSRYVVGGKIDNWPVHRRWASRITNQFVKRVLGLSVMDCSSGFRAYRVSMLRRLDLSSVRSDGYAFYEEVLWRMQRLGARFQEVPIRFVDRVAGQSKVDARQALAAIAQLVFVRWRG